MSLITRRPSLPRVESKAAKIIPWKGLVEVEPLPSGRPLSFWLERYPPGWISRHEAATTDPLARARDVHGLLLSFLAWLRKSTEERWDTFTLQALSAALFNRYPLKRERWPKRNSDLSVGLLQLAWPADSEAIQDSLAELQALLGPPLAVFKAVRCAISAEDVPLPDDFDRAGQAFERAHPRLIELADALERLLATTTTKRPPTSTAP